MQSISVMEGFPVSALRVLLLVVAGGSMCVAMPWGFVPDTRYLELPVCASLRKPCKILMGNADVSERDLAASSGQDRPICTCPGTDSCPVVWGQDPQRTLSFYINIGGRQTEVEYKFCEPVTDDRPCVGDEVVASLGGHSILPTQLEVKNCKCPSQRPMHLKQVVTSGFRKRQDFVCSMPVCDINRSEPQSCMRLQRTAPRESAWKYECQCPDEHMCRVDPNDRNVRNLAEDQEVSGYCRRL